MEPKKISYEEMKDLSYGNEIILKNPLDGNDEPYVLMSKVEGKCYFVGSSGASFIVQEQKTIDAFNVRLIDDTHPSWHPSLSLHGKEVGNMLEYLDDGDGVASDEILSDELNLDHIGY